MGNIVENARRYAGGITSVTVTAPSTRSSSASRSTTAARASHPEERDAIFGRFARGEAGLQAGTTSGTGLGSVARGRARPPPQWPGVGRGQPRRRRPLRHRTPHATRHDDPARRRGGVCSLAVLVAGRVEPARCGPRTAHRCKTTTPYRSGCSTRDVPPVLPPATEVATEPVSLCFVRATAELAVVDVALGPTHRSGRRRRRARRPDRCRRPLAADRGRRPAAGSRCPPRRRRGARRSAAGHHHAGRRRTAARRGAARLHAHRTPGRRPGVVHARGRPSRRATRATGR